MSTKSTKEEVVALQFAGSNKWNEWHEDPQDYKIAKIRRELLVLRSLVLLLTFIGIALFALTVWILCFKPLSEYSPPDALQEAVFHAQTSNDAREELHNTNSTCYKELQKLKTTFTAMIADSTDELRGVIHQMNTTLTEKVQTVRKMRGPTGPKGVCTCLSSPRGGEE